MTDCVYIVIEAPCYLCWVPFLLGKNMFEEKKCKDCGLVKDASSFSRDRAKKSGLATYCKPCSLERYRAYYRINGDIVRERSKKFFEDNRDHCKNRAKNWVKNNREKNLRWRRKYHKERYENNIKYRLNHVMRAMLSRASRGVESSMEKIGYTESKLKDRLQFQFKDGMCWSNYGEWEIDHKIPISVMIEKGETRPEKINMLSNLQPLWKEKNRSKGARYIG